MPELLVRSGLPDLAPPASSFLMTSRLRIALDLIVCIYTHIMSELSSQGGGGQPVGMAMRGRDP